MKKITIAGVTYCVPANWNEITTEQLVALIRLCAKQPITSAEIQLKFFLHCVYGSVKNHENGTYTIKTRATRHELTADELTSVLTAFDYLFDTNDVGEQYISPKFTINHFKRVKVGCTTLYGPDDALWDITYDQFADLQTLQSQFNDNPDVINDFINVIYKTKSGKRDVKNVRGMSEAVKTAILWFYLGSMNFLQEKFTKVFSGTGDANVNVYDYQQRIIDSLASGDVTKKMQVRESLLPDALYSMEAAAERIKEMEKSTNKK
jgi:hypothetical protein